MTTMFSKNEDVIMSIDSHVNSGKMFIQDKLFHLAMEEILELEKLEQDKLAKELRTQCFKAELQYLLASGKSVDNQDFVSKYDKNSQDKKILQNIFQEIQAMHNKKQINKLLIEIEDLLIKKDLASIKIILKNNTLPSVELDEIKTLIKEIEQGEKKSVKNTILKDIYLDLGMKQFSKAESRLSKLSLVSSEESLKEVQDLIKLGQKEEVLIDSIKENVKHQKWKKVLNKFQELKLIASNTVIKNLQKIIDEALLQQSKSKFGINKILPQSLTRQVKNQNKFKVLDLFFKLNSQNLKGNKFLIQQINQLGESDFARMLDKKYLQQPQVSSEFLNIENILQNFSNSKSYSTPQQVVDFLKKQVLAQLTGFSYKQVEDMTKKMLDILKSQQISKGLKEWEQSFYINIAQLYTHNSNTQFRFVIQLLQECPSLDCQYFQNTMEDWAEKQENILEKLMSPLSLELQKLDKIYDLDLFWEITDDLYSQIKIIPVTYFRQQAIKNILGQKIRLLHAINEKTNNKVITHKKQRVTINKIFAKKEKQYLMDELNHNEKSQNLKQVAQQVKSLIIEQDFSQARQLIEQKLNIQFINLSILLKIEEVKFMQKKTGIFMKSIKRQIKNKELDLARFSLQNFEGDPVSLLKVLPLYKALEEKVEKEQQLNTREQQIKKSELMFAKIQSVIKKKHFAEARKMLKNQNNVLLLEGREELYLKILMAELEG